MSETFNDLDSFVLCKSGTRTQITRKKKVASEEMLLSMFMRIRGNCRLMKNGMNPEKVHEQCQLIPVLMIMDFHSQLNYFHQLLKK